MIEHLPSLSKLELMFIAEHPDGDLDIRYEAARILQDRYIPEEIKGDMIYRLGTGASVKEVAGENGLSEGQVFDFLRNAKNKWKSYSEKV